MEVLKKVAKRLKNKKIAVAVISGILMILLNLSIIDAGMFDKYMEIANIALGIGVSVGVLSNPDSHIKE